MAACDAQHPEETGRRCLLPSGSHVFHQDPKGVWGNEPEQERSKIRQERRPNRKKAHQSLVEIAAGGAQSVREFKGSVSPGVPAEAVSKWLDDEWVTYAGRTFEAFLRRHPGDFTTAEDVWPLLDRPEEMRAMVQVVRRLLRAGYMKEVAAKRLKGVYRTKDGYEFAENKLVPVYRSLICSSPQGSSVD